MLDYDGMDRRRGGGDGQRPNAKTSANGGLVAQQKREEGGSGEAEKEGGRTALAVEIELLRAESEGMKKEIAEQERLLAAYQKENEKLLGQAKKVCLFAYFCVLAKINTFFFTVLHRDYTLCTGQIT